MDRKIYIHYCVQKENPGPTESLYKLKFDSVFLFLNIEVALRRFEKLIEELGDHKVFVSLRPVIVEEKEFCPAAVTKRTDHRGKLIEVIDIDPNLNSEENFAKLTVKEMLFGGEKACPIPN